MTERRMHVLTVLCAGGWMPDNLSEGWRRTGCEVHEFCYGTHMGRDWSGDGRRQNDEVNGRLLALARQLKAEGRLDLIFAVIYDDVLQVRTARLLRALGVPMVNYHVDLVGQWYRVLRTGRYFERVACAQEVHWAGLKRAGIRPWLMPMAANPPLEEAPDSAGTQVYEGVLYLGSPWVYRRQVLAELAGAGVPLRVYGHNWRPGPPVPSEAKTAGRLGHDLGHYLLPRMREEGMANLLHLLRERRAARRPSGGASVELPREVVRGSYGKAEFAGLVEGAAINLGFSHFSGIPGTAREQRQGRFGEFEIPMRGGFLLAQRCAELGPLFREDEHLACWDGSGELVEKARHYLERPAERARIAAAGQRHAAARHTWEMRFRSLLAELGLRAPAGVQ